MNTAMSTAMNTAVSTAVRTTATEPSAVAAPTSASARLRAAMALLVPALGRSGARLWNHPDLAVIYPRYLMAMHHVIRASVPLMAEAARALRDPARDVERRDVECREADRAIAGYLEHHIPEETGHDDWALEDLERLGIARGAVLAAHPYPAAAALAGTQYYYIRHHDPAAILGYIAQLEGYPPNEAALLAAADRTGLPVAAFRTMRKHAHLDPHHRRDLDRLIDALPPDEHRSSLILRSALDSGGLLATLIDEVCTRPPDGPRGTGGSP
jgi:hypothetical protein